jgi:hypothetical protein
MQVLIIAGAADNLLRANLHDYSQLPEGSLCVLADAGHETAHHDPVGTARAIHAFVHGRAFSAQSHRKTVEARLLERGYGPTPRL